MKINNMTLDLLDQIIQMFDRPKFHHEDWIAHRQYIRGLTVSAIVDTPASHAELQRVFGLLVDYLDNGIRMPDYEWRQRRSLIKTMCCDLLNAHRNAIPA